jgi:hypothetical protein
MTRVRNFSREKFTRLKGINPEKKGAFQLEEVYNIQEAEDV